MAILVSLLVLLFWYLPDTLRTNFRIPIRMPVSLFHRTNKKGINFHRHQLPVVTALNTPLDIASMTPQILSYRSHAILNRNSR